jgi:hypothetical protein
MRIASSGHPVFSITMIGLGIVGLLYPDFVPVWNPVPASIPGCGILIYLGPLISLASGIGLLVPRVAAIATRLLLATLLLWLLLFRLPNFLFSSPFEACWSVFPLAVILAAAWVLYVWFASDWDRQHLSFISGNNGLRIAHVLYGFSLIFFGSAHFYDVKDTLSLIPNLLSALQIGCFLLIVWIPIVAACSKVPFQWSETILNAALLAAAWMVADSYQNTPWLVADSQQSIGRR